MCGIVGVIGAEPAAPLLLEALRRLEYRGYDSAGIATLVDDRIERRRAPGKLVNLAEVLAQEPLPGTTGIGHTRWATHGAPTQRNAHPHGTPRVSVVHNGIIENHAELRAELEQEGQVFETETDTETVAQLVDLHLRQGMAPVEAARAAFGRLEGAYALALVFAGHPELMIGAQHGAPLAVGFGESAMYLGSDSLALAPMTRRIAYLHDGDWAVVSRDNAAIFGPGGPVNRPIRITVQTGAVVGKDGYRHFMEKELHEHPAAIGQTLARMLDPAARVVTLPAMPFAWDTLGRMTIAACGGAYFAGLAGRHWMEELARLPTEIDFASELRYRAPPLPVGGVGLLVSQSGETADTLAALRYMQQAGQHIVSVLNVPESTMARESDIVLETVAGPEIGVASTKAFTAQLTVMACLAIGAARARGRIDAAHEARLVAALLELPSRATEVLANEEQIRKLAVRMAEARDVLCLGRGACHAIALEAALKLKEICYIHAEGYAAGEMKHGPIALIDRQVPIVSILPSGPLFEKTASNVQEAGARGGQIVVLSDAAGCAKMRGLEVEMLELPTVDPFVAPILYAVAVQMLAYHTALLRGTDVDQPRNLAKSVTVE
ncbi:MAG: glutamine--fructose-6-phosphate transaminase (isomerizing) [Acetobacteraceae bacterium]